jgi:hypothetical protein
LVDVFFGVLMLIEDVEILQRFEAVGRVRRNAVGTEQNQENLIFSSELAGSF